jgi:hypothetical protein
MSHFRKMDRKTAAKMAQREAKAKKTGKKSLLIKEHRRHQWNLILFRLIRARNLNLL